MAYFDFTELNESQLEKKDNEFFNSIYNTQDSAAAKDELAKFFDKHGAEAWKYRNSYWRWFVLLSWTGFLNLTADELLSIIRSQVPAAILLNIDVLRNLLSYFRLNYSEENLGSYFKKIKAALFESGAVLGILQKKEIKMSELAADFVKINVQGKDPLRMAEFKAKLRKLFSPTDNINENYFLISPDEAVDRFVALLTFFTDINPEKLWSTVEKFSDLNYVELYKRLLNQTAVEAPIPTYKSQKTQVEEAVVPAAVKSEPQPVSQPKVTLKKKMTFAEMKERINNQFEKDGSGQFMNIAEVLKELERLAAMEGDERIRDLYIFNEKDGRFEWNEELLNK